MSDLEKLECIETIMQKMPQLDIPVVDHFSHGVYGREIKIPANTVLTGRIHKFSNLNVLSKGDISVLTDSGVVRFKAPAVIVSPPGTKRIAYTHEDCVWVTVHGTNQTDVDLIEAEFTAATEQEYLFFQEQKKLIGGA